jgi:undecaprenyl-diphosphatase
MTLTAEALWLNSFFSGYDTAILSFAHKMAELAGSVLTPLNKIITLLGEKGILFFLLAVVLMLFPRFRRTGVCMFGAVCCGALITNIILKDLVARPRPFESLDLYRSWWTAVGAPAEDDFSFPSGHVTALTAGMTALCLTCRRRNRPLLISAAVVSVLLMAISRNYLVAHYPSDVLFAAVIGLFSAVVAYAITLLIFRLLEDHDDIPFCADILDFDVRWIPSLIRSSRYKGRAEKAAAAPAPEAEAVEPEAKASAPEPIPVEPEAKPAAPEPISAEPEAKPAKPEAKAARPKAKFSFAKKITYQGKH